ncbi:hypothetical protein N7510_011299 [Penicillium lagena]|uniref:uncharacterized protein n=1 Tax=Penicillium lagena TaxID=94218 RepID=UPI002540DC8A|nr:uncharacterized protein N7510_011299 [Penicillium lagena]KAJ5601765.1 hypothetical protein N7510_011299 [Penicillium lagena]
MSASSSSESDSSSSRSSSPEPANQQKQAVKATKTESTNEDESSSSGSDSSSDEESDNGGAVTKSSAQPETEPANRVTISVAQPYKPPTGFKLAKKQPPPSSKTSSLLSNLTGKQVFHITAPSSLPLSKIKEVSMAMIMKGEPLLTHEGVNYGIPAESLLSETNDPEGKALLIYDQSTQSYRSAAAHVPTYHIQELVGSLGTDKATDRAVEALRDEKKPRKRQPKGLKMRFRPIGSLSGPPETIGDSSESEAEEEPTFKVPLGGEREEQRKRKHAHEGDAAPRKKSKKHERDDEGGKTSKKSHKDKEEKKRKKAAKA